MNVPVTCLISPLFPRFSCHFPSLLLLIPSVHFPPHSPPSVPFSSPSLPSRPTSFPPHCSLLASVSLSFPFIFPISPSIPWRRKTNSRQSRQGDSSLQPPVFPQRLQPLLAPPPKCYVSCSGDWGVNLHPFLRPPHRTMSADLIHMIMSCAFVPKASQMVLPLAPVGQRACSEKLARRTCSEKFLREIAQRNCSEKLLREIAQRDCSEKLLRENA